MSQKTLGGSSGFTLIESMVTLAVLGLLALGIGVAFKTASAIHLGAMISSPLALTKSSLAGILRNAARSASCVARPQPGFSGNVLVGYTGQDCEHAPFDGFTAGYFAFCLGADKRLWFQSGSGPGPTVPDAAVCSDTTGWYALSASNVEVSRMIGSGGLFTVNANTIVAQFQLKVPIDSELVANWAPGNEVLWVSTFTAQQPLSGT